MQFEYIKNYYKVNPVIGNEIMFQGKRKGVIVKDCDGYLGVHFYGDKATAISKVHPTWEVEYLETIGKLPKLTSGQKRYQRFLEADWFSGSFYEYMRYEQEQKKNSK